jgi:ribosomal protein S18 acetylase RimI-like enzyme
MFLGLLDDVPVATVYLHLAAVRTPGVSPPVLPGPVSAPGQSATVHYVVTLPEYRRRGIGAVMTEFALREARAAGCRSAVLTASALGAGVYRRLGFRETGLVSTYVWSPDWA